MSSQPKKRPGSAPPARPGIGRSALSKSMASMTPTPNIGVLEWTAAIPQPPPSRLGVSAVGIPLTSNQFPPKPDLPVFMRKSPSPTPSTLQLTRPTSQQSVLTESPSLSPSPSSSSLFGRFVPIPPMPYQRSIAEKVASPDRINLDKRKLAYIPQFEAEDQLKLLNLQSNMISEISNLWNLTSLIFLDLYNNRITKICNLECIPSLRVLMLGKNQITTIENLGALTKLDVLDLHSNLISKIENLEHLRELRVLNLAGNKITAVENVECLSMLTEINLRRNSIERVSGLENLMCLQRVFLSNNKLSHFSAMECVFKIKNLSELALDGNPAIQDPSVYRFQVIDSIKTLKALDLKRVSDDERRSASDFLSRFTWEPSPSSSSNWTTKKGQPNQNQNQNSPPLPLPLPPDGLIDPSVGLGPNQKGRSTPNASSMRPPSPAPPPPPPPPPPPVSSVEFDSTTFTLTISHNASEPADVPRMNLSTVEILILHKISLERLLVNPWLTKLKKLTNVQILKMSENATENLASLAKLGSIFGKSVKSLYIENNPVVLNLSASLLRGALFHSWKALIAINGYEISGAERKKSGELFSGFQTLSSMSLRKPEGFEEDAASNSNNSDGESGSESEEEESSSSESESGGGDAPGSALNSFFFADTIPPISSKCVQASESYVKGVVGHAVGVNAKIAFLNKEWPAIISQLVQKALEEAQNPEDFMAHCLDDL